MRLGLSLSLTQSSPRSSGGGGGGRPAWLPAWADSGVSYENGEAYFNDTLITDLTTIHGVNFAPSAVTASGMEVGEGNSNRPTAAGAFLDRVADFDFSFRAHFDTIDPLPSIGVVMLITDDAGTGGGLAVEWGGGSGSLSVTDFNNGSFNTVGTIVADTEFAVAGSNNAEGWLSSLNGATAVLDTPQTEETATLALIGFESPNLPETGGQHFVGTLRSIFFGPSGATAAEVEERAALS